MVAHSCNPSNQKWRLEDHDFKASWGYIVKDTLKKPKKEEERERKREGERKKEEGRKKKRKKETLNKRTRTYRTNWVGERTF
jgi:hypothetical protein